MTKPLVTIGVCVRNGEDMIKDAIESIMSQDFPQELMEAIFIDDGSTDETLSVVRNCVPKMGMKVKVFHHEWKGLGYSRNVVVNNANGEYIIWVDADMVLSRDFVNGLVKFMEQHPKVGIAKGKQALERGGNMLGTLEAYSRAAGRMVDYNSRKAFSKALGTGGAIYRIAALRQAGGFDENLRGYGEDMDIEIRIRAAGWLLRTTNVKFLDYERRGLSWKSLWSRYWLRGYYTHYFLHKNPGMLRHYKLFPPAAFLSGVIGAKSLFRLTSQKAVFLLPFQNLFKMSAWYVGFTKSHLNSHRRKYDGYQTDLATVS